MLLANDISILWDALNFTSIALLVLLLLLSIPLLLLHTIYFKGQIHFYLMSDKLTGSIYTYNFYSHGQTSY